jgi:hypothetical protein
MKLYYKDNSLPKELPFRITLSNGMTRTDPSSFTDEEIADAGYIEAPEKPRVVETGKSIFWNYETHEWEVVGKAVTEEQSANLWYFKNKETQETLLQETQWMVARNRELGIVDEEFDAYRQELENFDLFGDPATKQWPQYEPE